MKHWGKKGWGQNQYGFGVGVKEVKVRVGFKGWK